MQSPDAFAAHVSAKRMFIAGFTGEPSAVIDALERRPLRGSDARIVSVSIPGINRRDLSRLVPEGRVENPFVTPALRAAFDGRRLDFRPMHYTALFADLGRRRDIDLAVMRVSAPRNGLVSLGLAHDFLPALIGAGVPLAGMVDPDTPFVADGVTVAVDRLAALIDGPSPAMSLPADAPRPDLSQIAAHVAGLVDDGDTIQTGLGSAPNAVLDALCGHRNLALHGGMVSDAALQLFDSGALTTAVTGAAVCSAPWRRRLADDARIRFRGVDETHGVRALAAIDRFVAINSALEIDLFGQVNSEVLGGQQISGHGGVADFVRGARLSRGGRSIICLGATGQRGQVSRIVPALAAGTPVAVTRGDIDLVVTEHGVADLRDSDIDSRAERLIAIAAPAFRDSLAAAWDQRRRAM